MIVNLFFSGMWGQRVEKVKEAIASSDHGFFSQLLYKVMRQTFTLMPFDLRATRLYMLNWKEERKRLIQHAAES